MNCHGNLKKCERMLAIDFHPQPVGISSRVYGFFAPLQFRPLPVRPLRRGRLFKYDEVACLNTTRSPVQIRRVRLQIVNSFPYVLGEVGRTSKGRTCYGRNLQSTLSVTSYLKSLTAMPVNQVYEPFMYYLSITKKNILRTSVVSGFSLEKQAN